MLLTSDIIMNQEMTRSKKMTLSDSDSQANLKGSDLIGLTLKV